MASEERAKYVTVHCPYCGKKTTAVKDGFTDEYRARCDTSDGWFLMTPDGVEALRVRAEPKEVERRDG